MRSKLVRKRVKNNTQCKRKRMTLMRPEHFKFRYRSYSILKVIIQYAIDQPASFLKEKREMPDVKKKLAGFIVIGLLKFKLSLV